MITKSHLAFSLMACLGILAGCGDRADSSTETASAPPPATPADAPAAPADTTMPPPAADTATSADASGAIPADPAASATADERAALGVLNAINEHEIAAGNQALEKGVSGETRSFAELMIQAHTENRDKTSGFKPDSEGADVNAQRQKGEANLAALDKLSGDAYAKAYVDAMVKGHTEALAALDQKLIPKATTQAVKDHLASTREHVANHLERAKALQKK